MSRKLIACDVELSPNQFMIGFRRFSDGKHLHIEMKSNFTKDQRKQIMNVLQKYTLVTFNGIKFDMPLIYMALGGMGVYSLYEAAQKIIKERLPLFRTIQEFDIDVPRGVDHIDLIEPQPAVFIGLKALGHRLGAPKLQDLPYPYDKVLTDAEISEVREYNKNDLDITIRLYNKIEDEIKLRIDMGKTYGMDLRSKSGAQVAEAVLLKMTKFSGKRLSAPRYVDYVPPKCVRFESRNLRHLLDKIKAHKFVINQKNGSPALPDFLAKDVTMIGNTGYQFGLGGLHSKSKTAVFHSTDDMQLIDVDVASYYPSMLIEFGYYPPHIGKKFLTVYREIYKTRLAAKKAGDKFVSNSLKLVLNSSFGKLGSMYSKLYAPDMMLSITITGQLMLLMLIEALEDADIPVFYANTDGITLEVPKELIDDARAIIFDWELSTGMVMEEVDYKSCYIRDVNAYVNIAEAGYAKAIGVYKIPELKKNTEYPIVFAAIRDYLLSGKPMEDTLYECDDVKQFLSGRAVKKGGNWRGEYLGKVVRFYYSTDGDPIVFTNTHGNESKVATTDGCRPMMTLTETIPDDLDYDHYITLCHKHLKNLGGE